ncbi:MAG: DUF4838 domain-containing protein [Bacteroidetes bacterium]|nr:DUF4838 domain-containing protein [Bacteroidota bacterium]MDA1119873.1 DUF4838 domain-containing protein [Bacteroidota bacterium]
MNSPKKSNRITRLEFLKNSGLLATGITLLPGFVRANPGDEKHIAAEISDYQIVVPIQVDALEKQAGQQLQQYLSKIAGSEVPVVAESEFKGKKAIYIGKTDYAKAQKVDFTKIQGDGYTYKSAGNNLIIAGGNKKGVLYGVYDFLEGIGFRKLAPDYVNVPKAKDINLAQMDRTFTPSITYRTTTYGQMGDQEYSDWNKLSSRSHWGLFVHTFTTLMPPQQYGQSHPEYYSLINGVRQPATQLCLSNQEVADVLIANLKKKIAEKSDAMYWSVSQNDNDRYCQCDNCNALNEKYGGVPSGSVIYFTNKVAKAIPDRIISTLAYWYSRKAPQNIKIEPNVNIMLCNIESRRQAPVYETDPAFSKDLKDWGALTNDILIWDYNIQFTNFFGPFPNLYTLKPNIKFYTNNHVNALFMQANNEPAAEMSLLRAYLISKLMWKPDDDEKVIIDEFLNGYYSAAGPYIRQYIDSMHQSLVKSGMQLNIFGDTIDAKEAYLSAEMMSQYKQLFDSAEKAISNDPELLRRVQVARLPIMYAAIQIGRTEIDTPRSLYQRNGNGVVVGKPEMKALVNTFVEYCMRENVKLLRERSGSPEHFQAAYNRIFTNMEKTPKVKSFRKTITPITNPATRSKGVDGLTDGIFASYESWQSPDANWVYYTGNHMDFVLDLGEVMPVSSVNMDFLNPQAQPDWHLMSLPQYVSYATSVDGENYSDPIQIDNPNNPNPVENPEISKISIHSFITDLNGAARYIKVHAESLLATPSWHIRAGQPISIYTDQIVVS